MSRTGAIYEEQARLNGKVADRNNWRLVTLLHVAETREQARENVRFGLTRLPRLFRRCGDVPDRAAGIERSVLRGSSRAARPASARRTTRSPISTPAGGHRRFRRHHGAGAQLGGLGGDEAALRTDGALRAPALPALARVAQRELRLRARRTMRSSSASRPRRCRRRSTGARASAKRRNSGAREARDAGLPSGARCRSRRARDAVFPAARRG